MLRPKKKISKREIKEDKLVSSYFEATSWYEQNKKLVSTVITGVIILVVIAVVVRNNIVSNNEQAQVELAKVMPYFDRGNYEGAMNGIPQENIRGLTAIVNDYGSTGAGEYAKFYLAGACYATQRYDNALEFYLDVDVDDELIQSSALAGAAACYEVKGDRSNAAQYFERAAQFGKSNPLAPEHLHHAAMNYAAAGNKEKAIALLQKVKKDYPTSQLARDIERYIAQVNS
ncbi:MAG: tetratricopeptide repeat protein [Ignavibacteriae bacterium]|nr:tetratricopeptide repeat protein [Ignavibacteriota bacterium]